jgi:hypothetical protein
MIRFALESAGSCVDRARAGTGDTLRAMGSELSARRGKRLAAAIVVVLAMLIDHCQSRVPEERVLVALPPPPSTASVAAPPIPTGVAPPSRPGVIMCRLPKH